MQIQRTERENFNAHFAGHVAPSRFSEKIGSTTYRVSVYFPKEEAETLETKIFRLIKNDLNYQSERAIIGLLQTGRLPERGSL